MEEDKLQQCQLFDHDEKFQDFSHGKYGDNLLICVSWTCIVWMCV